MTTRRALILFFVLAFASGCAKAPARIAVTEGARNAQAILVERSLKEADTRVKTLRGLAEAILIDENEEKQTDVALVIVRPNKIRADAVDLLADVWAAAGTDGLRMWLWVPQKNKLYRGRATPGNLRRLAAFDWEIPEIVSIASGLIPGARQAELIEVTKEGGLHYSFKDKPLDVWVDPKTNNPVRLVRYKMTDGEKTVQYEVEFSGYKPVGDTMFPHNIDVKFPERSSSFYLRYKEIELNAAVDPSIFKPETVWRRQSINIDKKE
jgi:outer membrane lipoprotein-sorting protein